jgi:hypothetical protein
MEILNLKNMRLFVKYRKIIFPISIILIPFIVWLIAYKIALNYSFNGIVEYVSYDVQHKPTITIKGIKYNLDLNNWGHYQDTIEVGDSMIKKKGETFIKLIKRDKQKNINFLNK